MSQFGSLLTVNNRHAILLRKFRPDGCERLKSHVFLLRSFNHKIPIHNVAS
jgi:hypothetical protein